MKDPFRISDIFRKTKKDKLSSNAEISISNSKDEVKDLQKQKIQEKQPQENPQEKQINVQQSYENKINFFTPQYKEKDKEKKNSINSDTGLVRNENDNENREDRGNAVDVNLIYSEAFLLVSKIYVNEAIEVSLVNSVKPVVQKIVDVVNNGENKKKLLKTAFVDYPDSAEYLWYHIVNVVIFAIYLGKIVDYNDSQLKELGIAAFFHDIGLIQYLNLINQPGRLTNQQYADIKKHPGVGVQILESFRDSLDGAVLDVIRQEHERVDGSGYPEGLKGNHIHEYAQIVGLSDVYEALHHSRPYRNKYAPLEVVKLIIGNKKAFSYHLVKGLIEKIGIFPVGTCVQLNTREVVEVMTINPCLPLRPVVKVLLDTSGKKISTPKEINLAEHPTLYITVIVNGDRQFHNL